MAISYIQCSDECTCAICMVRNIDARYLAIRRKDGASIVSLMICSKCIRELSVELLSAYKQREKE